MEYHFRDSRFMIHASVEIEIVEIEQHCFNVRFKCVSVCIFMCYSLKALQFDIMQKKS